MKNKLLETIINLMEKNNELSIVTEDYFDENAIYYEPCFVEHKEYDLYCHDGEWYLYDEDNPVVLPLNKYGKTWCLVEKTKAPNGSPIYERIIA